MEEQSGVALVRRSGRGLMLTDEGETLLSSARRLLSLSDKALSAVRGVELEGWVRFGLQEDFGETVLPLCWLGAADEEAVLRPRRDEPLPIVTLEAPCLLRTIACEHLDRYGLAWRIAFVSPNLGGLWAETAAGLVIALRTPVGIPPSVRILDAARDGMPKLPSLGFVLHRADSNANPHTEHLAVIIRQAVQETLPGEWLRGGARVVPSRGARIRPNKSPS